MTFLTFKSVLLLVALTSIRQVAAHSWVEQMALISSNGSYTGAMGYSRNYVARTDPGFASGDYLVPQASAGRSRIAESDLLCAPNQRTQTQSAKWPRLQVTAGSAIAIKYLENGHVSLALNNPGKGKNSGTVFVFGTTSPSSDEKLADVLKWTKDGSGGDKRGYLLAANDYDDLRCYQINGGAISTQRQAAFPDSFPGQTASRLEQWCETNVVFPTDTSIMAPGKLMTIYWVWDWATTAGIDPGLPAGKDEYYTTCADLEIVASLPDNAPLSNLLGQQDPQTKAVSNHMSRTAVAPVPRALNSTPSAVSGSAGAAPAPNVKPLPLAGGGAGSIITVIPTPMTTAASSSSTTISMASLSIPVPLIIASSSPAMALSTIIGPRPAVGGVGGNSSQGIPSFSSSSSRAIIAVSSSAVPSSAPISYFLSQPALSSSSSPSASSSSSSALTPAVLTAVITVLATLNPGETTVVAASHVITFSAPDVVATAAVSFRA